MRRINGSVIKRHLALATITCLYCGNARTLSLSSLERRIRPSIRANHRYLIIGAFPLERKDIQTMQNTITRTARSSGSILLPLFLAQFICSYAASNMNVAISSIATDLGTTVHGVQTAITLFTLTMAALMIPGSKLTDIWGRKFCLVLGLTVYTLGALLAALAPGLGVLIFGYSLLEGVGSALLIPPVYILVTVSFVDLTTRAKSFGIISAAGGIGAAAGPLIGGLITTTISWRASFLLQVLVVVLIIVLSRRIADPGIQGAKPRFDVVGAILSAAGLFFVVLGILQSGTYGWFTASQDFAIGTTVVIPQGGISPVWLFVGIGALILLWFFLHPLQRTCWQRAAVIHPLVPQPCLQPWAGDPKRPMAHPAGQLLRDLGLPADGPRIQRHSNRPDPHPGDHRHPALIGHCGQARAKVFPTNPHSLRLCHHHHRHAPPVVLSQCHLKHPHLHSRPSADGSGSGSHADLLGQRRAVQLSRARPG